MILRLELKPLQTECSIPKPLWLLRILKELYSNRKLPVALVQHNIQGPNEPERWADELWMLGVVPGLTVIQRPLVAE
jgi:hypothetical protein